MNLVFTMAGKYSRFKLFGSKVPKYLLPLSNGTILLKIMELYKDAINNINFFFIANRDDQLFFPILRSVMRNFKIPDNHLIYVDDTSSQLETAMIASELIPNSEKRNPICFANIDTVVSNRENFFKKLKICSPSQGLIDTFKGQSKHYSFIRSKNNHLVSDIVDNSLVSNKACSGLYGFGSFEDMIQQANILLKENGSANFTQLYQSYIKNSRDVYFVYSENLKDTIVLGTPEEYVINIHRFK